MKTWIGGLCLGLLASVALASPGQPVETRQGLVSGTDTRIDGVSAWDGIPYTAPPVGTARRRATHSGAAHNSGGGFSRAKTPYAGHWRESEPA